MSLPDPETLTSAGLLLAVDGPLATVTLNKPARRNSMTPAMWAALAAIGDNLPEEVRVVVLKGAGESFSAGLDRSMLTPQGPEGETGFAELLAGSDQDVIDEIGRYQDGFVWLQRPELLTIAQVHGHAIGAGFQLALQCDLRVVANDVQFCMKEPALGLVPDLAGTKPLVAAVGYSRATEICATARFVGAPEAAAIGLASLAVARDELDETVADLVAAILANGSDAVRGTKALLQGAEERTLDEQRLAERTAQAPLLRRLAGG